MFRLEQDFERRSIKFAEAGFSTPKVGGAFNSLFSRKAEAGALLPIKQRMDQSDPCRAPFGAERSWSATPKSGVLSGTPKVAGGRTMIREQSIERRSKNRA